MISGNGLPATFQLAPAPEGGRGAGKTLVYAADGSLFQLAPAPEGGRGQPRGLGGERHVEFQLAPAPEGGRGPFGRVSLPTARTFQLAPAPEGGRGRRSGGSRWRALTGFQLAPAPEGGRGPESMRVAWAGPLQSSILKAHCRPAGRILVRTACGSPAATRVLARQGQDITAAAGSRRPGALRAVQCLDDRRMAGLRGRRAVSFPARAIRRSRSAGSTSAAAAAAAAGVASAASMYSGAWTNAASMTLSVAAQASLFMRAA